jgi:glucose-6-phosphate 1-dehydrogenase
VRLLVFGAGGDLARRLLFPALAELNATDGLPDDLEIIGVTRDEQPVSAFRREVADALAEHAPTLPDGAASALAGRVDHQRADVTDEAAMNDVVSGPDPAIAYLALPPALFEPTLQTLAGCDLVAGSRVVVEKPFGEDLETAVALNRLLADSFDEEAVYRMDHFLGLAATRHLLTLRFANRLLEPAWSAEQIERVEITWDETLALEGRAGYYDEAGALRDMVQNHLLALMSVVGMERPDSFSGDALRRARTDLLRAVRPVARDEVAGCAVRARYTAGTVEGHAVPAYVDEDGVDPSRETETFAQLTLSLDAPRWAGVPFVLRSGKALGRDRHELTICFRPAPLDGAAGNRLTIDLDTSRLGLALNANGPSERLAPVEIGLDGNLPPGDLSAYAVMLRAVIAGDQTPFVRADEAEEAWRIVQPVLDAWQDGAVPLLEYAAGSDGPG